MNFLSNGWGGRATDIYIVRNSGFISSKFHCPGDQILSDRGFPLQDNFALSCSAEFIIPAFMKGGKNSCLQRKLKLLEKLQVFKYTLKEL